MFFFPIRADLDLRRVPFVTPATMVVCVLVFLGQLRSESRVSTARAQACGMAVSPATRMALTDWAGAESVSVACEEVLVRLSAPERPSLLALSQEVVGTDVHAASLRPQVERELSRIHRRFLTGGGRRSLTERLVYEPDSWNPVTMVTAAFAHGGWFHLIGNLFFFWVFAAALEGLLGWWRFALLLIGLSIGTHVVYSLAASAVGGLPTLGLSGVVYGVMGLFAWLAPGVKIEVFVWFLVWLRTVEVPAWLIALLYVGTDAWELYSEGMVRGVNLVAHVSGALIAVGAGLLFLRGRRLSRLDPDRSGA